MSEKELLQTIKNLTEFVPVDRFDSKQIENLISRGLVKMFKAEEHTIYLELTREGEIYLASL